MDTTKYSVLLVKLEAYSTQGAYLTNAGYPLTYEGNVYVDAGALAVELPSISGTIGTKDCNIKKIPIAGEFLTRLSNNMPFSKVEVSIYMQDINPATDAVLDTHHVFDGLLYQASPSPLKGYMDLICKDWKYYTDITAGMLCTEQCAWLVFGGKGCGAYVAMESHEALTIDGYFLTIADDLVDTTSFLFNKGYIELEGVRIKIKYHETGRLFQMAKAPPSEWSGRTVSIYAGCDRSIKTCREIHDNESQYLGLGFSMVDYNPFYESA